jgi:hypothetical protein
MKLLKKITITKEIKEYQVHPDISNIFIRETLECEERKNAYFFSTGAPHDSQALFYKPGFLEAIKIQNPFFIFGKENLIETFRITAEEILDGEYTVSPENLVWVYSAGSILFDINGDPIPFPFPYDYIGSPFSNEYCDLKGLLKHLKSHPWVLNKENLVISSVPYYNNEEGWRKYIEERHKGIINILPTKDALKEIYQRAIKDKGDFFSTRMNELIFSGMPYEWPCSKDYERYSKKIKVTPPVDYLQIRQFYSPYKK